jgi:SSS family solute:Na+ symporter
LTVLPERFTIVTDMFSPLNRIILFSYMATMLLIGLWLARRQTTTQEFFLAGRRMPWIVVAMSMYASLTSAVTFMALPAMAFRENISLIVVCVVSPVVAPLLVRIFYPFYHRLGVTTSYEYIGQRFGPSARMAVSSLFVLYGVGWLGAVIYAPSLALSTVSTMDIHSCVLLMGLIATAYTSLGGMSADIWTDVVQFVIMIVGEIWIAVSLIQEVPGGFFGIMSVAHDSGHLATGGLHFDLGQTTVCIVAVSFFLQMMQQYGTDQCTVQRMMTTPTLSGIKKAIYFNAVTDFIVIGTLLFIGLGLFAFSKANPSVFPSELPTDALVPFYVIHALPDGVSGLMVTALLAAAMSSMDSGIGSISTVIVNDLVRPWAPMTDRRHLTLAKTLTLVIGLTATAVAFQGGRFGSLVENYTAFISLFSAPVLSLFLLGILTRHANFSGWLIGCALSIPATLWIQWVVKASWVYHFPFSFAVSFVVGYCASFFFVRRPVSPGLILWNEL